MRCLSYRRISKLIPNGIKHTFHAGHKNLVKLLRSLIITHITHHNHIKARLYMHLPPNTVIFAIFLSSLKLSPNAFVAVTKNSYSFLRSNWTATWRARGFLFSLTLPQSRVMPSTLTLLWYKVYLIMGAPLLFAWFHCIVWLVFFVLAGRHVISVANGTP